MDGGGEKGRGVEVGGNEKRHVLGGGGAWKTAYCKSGQLVSREAELVQAVAKQHVHFVPRHLNHLRRVH